MQREQLQLIQSAISTNFNSKSINISIYFRFTRCAALIASICMQQLDEVVAGQAVLLAVATLKSANVLLTMPCHCYCYLSAICVLLHYRQQQQQQQFKYSLRQQCNNNNEKRNYREAE